MKHDKPHIYCILKAESNKLNWKDLFINALVYECPKHLKSCIPCWTAVRKRQLKEVGL